MADFLSPQERSERMARIRGQNTRPELQLRSLLHASGLRYRLHVHDLPGRPDIVFPKYQAVVFVHGCFWHHHGGCRIANTPKSNTAFWEDKFRRNQTRDARNSSLLEEAGWRVLVVWECELSSSSVASATASRVRKWVQERPTD